MSSSQEHINVLCITGARSLNKRMSLFIEGVLDAGAGVRVLALPRGRWSLQRFESQKSDAEASTLELRFGYRRDSRLAAVLCFHWAVLPLAILIARVRRVPVLYDEHDHYEINTHEHHGPSVRRWFSQKAVRLIHRLCLPYVSLITCIHLANDVLKRHLSQWQPNVLELHNYPVAAWRAQSSVRSHIQPLSFVYMGGVFAEKGVRQAAEAYLSLPDDVRSRCHLHIFGDGDSQLIAELQRHPGVILHDSLSPAELRDFVARHRCCGLVLYNEHPRYRLIGTNSRKLYEYLAMGMPVIATSVGELGGFIRRHRVGIVVNSRIIPEELTQAMLEISQSYEQWKELSRHASELMHEPAMSWEHEWNKVIGSGVLDGVRRAA